MKRNLEVEREEKRRYWQEHLERWQASGKSQAGYCTDENLSIPRFNYWKRKLFGQPQPPVPFVELPVGVSWAPGSLGTSTPPVSLVIDGRYRLEIHSGCDLAVVEQVTRMVSRL